MLNYEQLQIENNQLIEQNLAMSFKLNAIAEWYKKSRPLLVKLQGLFFLFGGKYKIMARNAIELLDSVFLNQPEQS